MSTLTHKRVALILLLSEVALTGCLSTLDITPKEVEANINAALKPGDGADKIEAYFEREGLVLSYDRFQDRYQSIIRHPKSNFHTITIHVYVDKAKQFIRVEANDSYTFL